MANYKEGSEEAEKRKKKITVYGSQAEYNAAHKAEIDAGLMKPSNTVVHARSYNSKDPASVARAEKEHEAAIDSWRIAQGLEPHSEKFWSKDSVKRRGKDYSGYDPALIVKYDLDRQQQEAANLAPLMKASAQSVSGAGAEQAQRSTTPKAATPAYATTPVKQLARTYATDTMIKNRDQAEAAGLAALAAKQATTPANAVQNVSQAQKSAKAYAPSPAMQTKSAIGQMIAGTSNKQPAQSTPSTAFLSPALKSRIQTGENIAKQAVALDRDLMNANDYGAALINNFRSAPSAAVTGAAQMVSDLLGGEKTLGGVEDARAVRQKAQEQLQNSLKGKSELEQTLMSGVYSLVENVSIMLFSPVKGAVLPLMGASQAADSYTTYKAIGVPTGEAVTRAATEGVISGFIEGIGGIGAGGAISKLANRTLASSLSKILGKDVSGALASLSTKLIPSILGNAGSEAFEEVAEYPLQAIASYLYNVVFGNTAGDVPSSWQEALSEVKRNASAAAVAGGIFSGANFAQNRASVQTETPVQAEETPASPTVATVPEVNETSTIDGQASGLPYNAFSTTDATTYTPNAETLSTGAQAADGTNVLNPAEVSTSGKVRETLSEKPENGRNVAKYYVLTRNYDDNSIYRTPVSGKIITVDGRDFGYRKAENGKGYEITDIATGRLVHHRNDGPRSQTKIPEYLQEFMSNTFPTLIKPEFEKQFNTTRIIPDEDITIPEADVVNPAAQRIDEAFANGMPEGEPSFGSATVGAAERNPKSYYALMNEYGTLPEGENPARTVDVPAQTSDTDKVTRFTRTLMEAKITPDEYMGNYEKAVESGVFSYQSESNEKALAKAAKHISEAPFGNAVAAFDSAFRRNLALDKDTLVQGMLVYATAVKNGDAELLLKTGVQLAQALKENGDAVQSGRILKQISEQTLNQYGMKVNTYFYETVAQRYSGVFDADIQVDPALMQNLLNAQNEEQVEAAKDAIEDNIAKQIPSNWRLKLNTWRMISMLFNLGTFTKNFLGSVLEAPARAASEAVKAGIERVPGVEKLGVTKETTLARPTAEQKSFATADFENVKDEIMTGGKYMDAMDRIVQRRRIYKTDALNKLNNALNWAMNNKAFGDEAFARMAFSDAESRYFKANNIDPKTATPAQINKAREVAISQAKDATFRQTVKLAEGISRLKRTSKVAEMAVDAVIPFVTIPINLAKTGVQYSPVGLLGSIFIDTVRVKKGTITANQMVEHLSKGIAGTAGPYAIGYLLSAMGLLVGGKKDKEKENVFDRLTGLQNYSLKIGDGTYTLNWLGPYCIPLFMGNETYNAVHGDFTLDNFVDYADAVLNVMNTTLDPVIAFSVMSGFNRMLKGAAGGDGVQKLATDMAFSYLMQYVPTALKQIARSVAPTAQSRYFTDKTDQIPDAIQPLINQLLVSIPGAQQGLDKLGLDYTIPSYMNAWGKKENPTVGERILENFISPGYWEEVDNGIVNKTIEELYKNTRNTAFLPSMLDKSYKVDGKDVYFSTEEYEKAQEIAGQTSKQMLEKLFSSPAYKSLTDDQKADWVSDIYDYAKKTAKKQVVGADYDTTRIERYKETGLGANGQVQLYRILESGGETAERDAQIAETFGVDEYTARDYRRKADGDYYYALSDIGNDAEKTAAKASLLGEYGFSEADVIACYNAHAGSGQKKADYIADATYALRNQGYSEEDAADMAFYFYAVANQLKGFKVE